MQLSERMGSGASSAWANMSERSTILLVDDVLEIRYLLRMLLANVRHCQIVGEAEDGKAACELVELHRPNAVVLDLWMPKRGGLDALPEIVATSPDTRVVVYTAATDADARREAIALGAHACVIKGGVLMSELPGFLSRKGQNAFAFRVKRQIHRRRHARCIGRPGEALTQRLDFGVGSEQARGPFRIRA